MLIDFFNQLKKAQLPISLKEFLDLLQALQKNIVFADLEDFYFLTRSILIKDEKFYDKFDRVFGSYFHGIENIETLLTDLIPEDWLRETFLRNLSEEDKAKIQQMQNLDELLKTLQERLQEQTEKHSGGNKWIGTGGTSPFGHSGYNPSGVRIGGKSQSNRAAKVWEQREFKNLDSNVELGTRNLKMALRNLRQFARIGNEEELDLDSTIKFTAENAGFLDLRMQKQKHNSIKVLLFLDVGGSMDSHIEVVEQLFSACKTEFKHLEYFYFHNCIYEGVWQDNNRRFSERKSTEEILRTYGKDYKIIFVGDASMSPWEITQVGGSVEHFNEQAATYWLERFAQKWSHQVWLNPVDARFWQFTQSIIILQNIMQNKMYPLTLAGLDEAIKSLMQK